LNAVVQVGDRLKVNFDSQALSYVAREDNARTKQKEQRQTKEHKERAKILEKKDTLDRERRKKSTKGKFSYVTEVERRVDLEREKRKKDEAKKTKAQRGLKKKRKSISTPIAKKTANTKTANTKTTKKSKRPESDIDLSVILSASKKRKTSQSSIPSKFRGL
jgi:hypothetical protein